MVKCVWRFVYIGGGFVLALILSRHVFLGCFVMKLWDCARPGFERGLLSSLSYFIFRRSIIVHPEILFYHNIRKDIENGLLILIIHLKRTLNFFSNVFEFYEEILEMEQFD